MPADQGPGLLSAHFGTQSPHWRLAFDSNTLELFAVKRRGSAQRHGSGENSPSDRRHRQP